MVKRLFLPYFFCIFVTKYKNMEDFKTQVCTTIEQSKQLIDLGINPDTADMGWFKAYSLKGEIYKPFIKGYKLENNKTDIPAWSLYRLIKMMPTVITHDDYDLMLGINSICIYYVSNEYSKTFRAFEGNLYECVIECIEWLIKENYFNI